jgi:cobalt-zinc-cadmium efflux system membrane fusion protein
MKIPAMNAPITAKREIAPAHSPAVPSLPKWLSLLALAGLLGCGKEESPTFARPPDPKVEGEKVVFLTNAPQLASISVQAAQARAMAVTHVTGRLYWNENTTVGVFTPVAGRVTHIRVDLGQTVSAGSPLAEIESPDFAQALASARAAVGNLAAVDKAFSRSKELLAHGAAAAKDVEAAEAAYVAALAERDRAEAVLANYGGSDKSTNSVYILRSQIAGVVVDKNINPGQELRADLMLANSPNLFSPSFVVSDPSKLWLQLDVAESDLSSLHPGLSLQIHSRSFPDKIFDGVVDRIGDTMDPSTRAIKVRGIVNNPDKLLKAEMYVLVDVVEDAAKAGLLGVEISSKALFMKGDDSFVFLEDSPGTFQRKQVRVGVEKDNKVPVLEGISPGQKVVIEGALLLQALVEPSS